MGTSRGPTARLEAMPIDPPSAPAGATGDQGVAPVRAPSYGWPNWLRRSIITVALVFCGVLLVYTGHRAQVGKTPKDRDPVILVQTPPPGGSGLRQSTVSADLKVGYDGRLVINGLPIPEAQMDGARDPSTVAPDDLKANGLRPNNHNHVAFTPGPGKVIEKFDPGQLTISLQYFRDHQARSTGRTITWVVNVD